MPAKRSGKLAALPAAARKALAALPLFAAPCRFLNALKMLIIKEIKIWHAPC
ncbi:hypothetical protein [Pseudomonas nicosulfuronedens]